MTGQCFEAVSNYRLQFESNVNVCHCFYNIVETLQCKILPSLSDKR